MFCSLIILSLSKLNKLTSDFYIVKLLILGLIRFTKFPSKFTSSFKDSAIFFGIIDVNLFKTFKYLVFKFLKMLLSSDKEILFANTFLIMYFFHNLLFHFFSIFSIKFDKAINDL